MKLRPTPKPRRYERLALLGVGLIGGSLARDLRALDLVGEVVGCSRTGGTMLRALELGVIDRTEANPEKAVEGADLVVVAVPMGVAAELTVRVLGRCRPGTLVTDVGSVKGPYVRAVAERVPEGVWFVGGHPIAGTERSGVEVSLEGLFRDARCILTPTERTPAEAVEACQALWEAVGARVTLMDPDRHDEILGAVSHLPHVLAFTAMNTLPDDVLQGFAGGGFRDFSRIASSDPVMWRDICLTNREALLRWVSRYEEVLAGMKWMIERGDEEGLEDAFRRARERRDALVVPDPPAVPPSGPGHPLGGKKGGRKGRSGDDAPVIAVDGPAGGGKSTASQRLALLLGYRYYDTGALYRALAWLAQNVGVDWEGADEDLTALCRDLDLRFERQEGLEDGWQVLVNGQDLTEELKGESIGRGASLLSARPAVRRALLDVQRRQAAPPGLVMEGRDVGTVVFPKARVKFFLTADPAERAQRRWREMQALGRLEDLESVERDVRSRDERDRTRAVSPLVPAEDAVEIDTTGRSVDEVVENMINISVQCLSRRL
ncbi:MAG: (d)CMP kinase [Candidatus Tectomicrobia bacterium]|nr:(d)CMP kinase [Candidatus Tectomicrobia bacterium]